MCVREGDRLLHRRLCLLWWRARIMFTFIVKSQYNSSNKLNKMVTRTKYYMKGYMTLHIVYQICK